MSRVADHLAVLIATLWVGALWAVGYIVAPTLFGMLDDRMLAGNIAGRLFTVVGWIGLAAAVYLLLFIALRQGARAFRSGIFWLVATMLALALVEQFGIQPSMAALKAEAGAGGVMDSALSTRFAALHGTASILYLARSLLGAVLVVRLRGVLR